MAHADTGSQTISGVAWLEHWILKEKLRPNSMDKPREKHFILFLNFFLILKSLILTCVREAFYFIFFFNFIFFKF